MDPVLGGKKKVRGTGIMGGFSVQPQVIPPKKKKKKPSNGQQIGKGASRPNKQITEPALRGTGENNGENRSDEEGEKRFSFGDGGKGKV